MPFPHLTKKEGRKKGGQKNKSQNGIIISIVPQCALFFWCLQWQELGEKEYGRNNFIGLLVFYEWKILFDLINHLDHKIHRTV